MKFKANIFIIVVAAMGLELAMASLLMSKPEWQWLKEKQHVFKYEGRLLTGIPQLAPHFSGLAIQCDVVVQTEKQMEGQTQIQKMWVRNPKFVDINHRLEMKSGDKIDFPEQMNWRNIPLPSLSDVPTEIKEQMEKPIEFLVQQPEGFIQKIFVSSAEPTWSINFKKALVTLFQIKMETSSVNIDKNQFQELSESGSTYWRTTEESMDGTCETTYQVNQIPEYMIKEEPLLMPLPGVCPQAKYYEIIKVKDIESCQNKPVFLFHKSSDVSSFIPQRSSQIRYLACGTLDKLVLQKIVNEAELNHGLFGSKLEKIMTGTYQYLVLKAVMPKQSQPVMPVTKTPFDLRYEIPLLKSSRMWQLKMVPMPSDGNNASTVLPRNMLCPEDALDYQSNRHLILDQVFSVIKSVVYEMVSKVEKSEEMLTNLILSAQRGLSLLRVEEIKKLYDRIKTFVEPRYQQVAMNVFYDLVSMTGTFPSTKFSLELMSETGEISLLKRISILMTLPAYIITPTPQLLEYYFSVVTSESVKHQPYLYKIGILGLSNLVQKSCLSKTKMTAYPSQMYGEFCNEHTPIVTQKLLPYLTQRLQTSLDSEKLIYVVALGSLGHKSILPILISIIEKKSYSTELRTTSLYALGISGKTFPWKAIPFVYSIFSRPLEATHVRIAAFEVLLKLNPPMSIVHQIATSTYFERNPEVFNAVITAFYSLAETSDVNPLLTIHSPLSRKVSLVKYLLAKMPTDFTMDGIFFDSTYLNKLGIGYKTVTSILGSTDSLMPKHIYKKISYITDSINFSPLEVAFSLKGLEPMYQQFRRFIDPNDPRAPKLNPALHNTPIELINLINKLDVLQKKPEEFSSYIYAKLFDNINFMTSHNNLDIRKLTQIVQNYVENPSQLKQHLCGKNPLNAQQIANVMPTEMLMPTEMGFPVSLLTSSLFSLSVRGELDVKCSSPALPSVYLSTVSKVYTGIVGRINTYSPFSKEILTTGLDQSTTLSVPFNTDVSLNIQEGKLSIKLLRPSVQEPTNLISYSVKPFTTSTRFDSFVPEKSTTKVVKSYWPKQKNVQSFGETAGLHLSSIIETESESQLGIYDIYRLLSLFNYNPVNLFRVSLLVPALSEDSYPSIRRHSYQLLYDPSRSQAKELMLSLDFGLSTKYENSPPIYYKLQTKTQARKNEDRRDILGLIPWTVISEPLSQKKLQPERQMAIEKMLEQLQMQSGYGVYIKSTLTFRGSRITTYAQKFDIAVGSRQMSTLWSSSIENLSGNPTTKMLCLKGELIHPSMALWNLKLLQNIPTSWKFSNHIGFGQTCTDSEIQIIGNSRVTEEKRQQTKLSRMSILCQDMLRRKVPGAQFSYPCIQARSLVKRLDYLDFTIKYKNIPKFLTVVDEKIMQLVKFLGRSYQSVITKYGTFLQTFSRSFNTKVKLILHEDTRTVDIYIERPNEKLTYGNIYYGYLTESIFPMSFKQNSLSTTLLSYLSEPSCKLDKSSVSTFDNKSLPLHLDDCFHLVAADKNHKQYFGVFVKQFNSQDNNMEVKLLVDRHTISLKPMSTHYGKNTIEIRVDGSVFEALTDSKRSIVAKAGNIIANVELTLDGVLVLNVNGYSTIFFNGEFLKIQVNKFMKDKLCGMCGNIDSVKLNESDDRCIYTPRELEATRYRVQTETCSQLPQKIKDQLRSQENQCRQAWVKPIWEEMNLDRNHSCSAHQHIIVEHGHEVCFSKIPLIKCTQTSILSCHPRNLIEKKIEFVCIPAFKSKLVQHYREKIIRKEVLEELLSIPASFETKIQLPSTCEPLQRSSWTY